MNTTIQPHTQCNVNFKKARNYTFWVLGTSWTIGFILYNTLDISNIIYKATIELTLAFMPAIIAFIMNKKEGGNWKSLQFIKPSLKGILLAIAIPFLYVVFDFYIQIYLGFRTTPDWALLGSTVQLLLTIVLGYLVMVILVMGEEIGWRGYLQGKLFGAFGEMKGVFILGLIWGLWHLPIALKGYLFPSYPYIEAFVTYPLACIAFSLIIAYIGFQKYSIFIAACLHATNNYFKATLIGITEVTDEFGFLLISNFVCVDLILVFTFLYWKKLKSKEEKS